MAELVTERARMGMMPIFISLVLAFDLLQAGSPGDIICDYFDVQPLVLARMSYLIFSIGFGTSFFFPIPI